MKLFSIQTGVFAVVFFVINLLVKKYGLINYCLNPTDWGYGHEAKYNYLRHGMEYPIWTCRNRSGKSILE